MVYKKKKKKKQITEEHYFQDKYTARLLVYSPSIKCAVYGNIVWVYSIYRTRGYYIPALLCLRV